MWSFRKPTAEQWRAFLAGQAEQQCSYPEVEATRGEIPPGYDHDHNRIVLGHGQAVFEAACDALKRWQMFPAPWTQIQPANTPLQVGQVVAVLARVFGVWWLNASRIVYVVDEAGPPRRFGFAYGTLPQHVERGEECFSVEWGADDVVWYDLRAFSRPRFWGARLAYPLTRRIQRRFVLDSQAAMRDAVAQVCSLPGGSLV